MTTNLSRRRLLGGTLGASVILGAGLVGRAPRALANDGPVRGCANPVIPVVPGMSGDPRANELWYQLDQVTFFAATPEFKQAIADVGTALGSPQVEEAIAKLYINIRNAGTYPDAFVSVFAPVRDQMEVISTTQVSVFETYYGCDPHGLIGAMADFGQGILYDPRRGAKSIDHMMNGNPPIGYHTWHAFNRAFAFLGIAAGFWNKFDPLVAFGWAVQSTAKPVTDAHNPPLPKDVVRALAKQYLRMPPRRIDEAFMSVPYPPGIS
jgi:hypothetical protein